MAADIIEFSIRYEGGRTGDGTMQASSFGQSLIALDKLYKRSALSLGAGNSMGVRFVSRTDRGSIISYFLASDEFRRAFGPMVTSTDILHTVRLAIECISSGLAIPIGLERYRSSRAKTAALLVDLDLKQLEFKKLSIEIEKLAAQSAINVTPHVTEATIALIQANGAKASFAALFHPLTSGEANSMSVMSSGTSTRVTRTDAMIALSLDEAALASSAQSQETSLRSPETEDVVLQVKVFTPQLTGKASGWRFNDGTTTFAATVSDKDFLKRVRRDEIVFSAGRLFIAHVRRAFPNDGSRAIVSQIEESAIT